MCERESRKCLVVMGLMVAGFIFMSGMKVWALDVSDIRCGRRRARGWLCNGFNGLPKKREW